MRPRAAAAAWSDETPDALPRGWRRHARSAHLALVARWVGRPRGRWLKTDLFEEMSPDRALLPALDGDWVGIDVSAAVAGGAQQAETVVADVRCLPFASRSFAGVLSTSTLDHFHHGSDIELSLAELRRVLAPGGALVLTLDNPTNPLIRLRNRLPARLQTATGLVPFFVGATLSERQGREALTRAGFEVVEVAYLLHAPHVLATRPARLSWWERRALPTFDRLGSTAVARWTGHYVAFLARAS